MVGRTDYTESDDDNLVKYIARMKPENSGRLGNNLYILLEESATQRPWAIRHSWQSWRERYKKNQQWFDYQIKRHQRKLTGEVPTKRNNKPEPDSTVNGANKPKMDKGKSGTNVEKLAQVQADKPEKEKQKKQASSVPVASSSTSIIKQASSAERKSSNSALQAHDHAPHLPDRVSRGQPSEVVEGNKHPAMVDIPSKPKVDHVQSKVKEASSQTGVQADHGDMHIAAGVTPPASFERIPPMGECSSSSPNKNGDEQHGEEEKNASEGEAAAQDLYRELFGASQFSDNEDETSDAHQRSSTQSSLNVNQDNIYPSIESVPQLTTVDKEPHIPGSVGGAVKIETTPILSLAQEPVQNSVLSSGRKPPTTSAANALQPRRPPHDKPKRKILPRDDDSHFFGTPTPSPSALAPNSIARGKSPHILESPYRTQKRTRATSGNATNDESWPPKRRKKTTEDIDTIGPEVKMSGMGDAYGGVETETNEAVPVRQSTTGNANGLARHHPPAPVNAVASSSKVLLPDPPHRVTKPTNLLKMIYAKGNPPSDATHKDRLPANNSIQRVANNGSKSALTDAAPRRSSSGNSAPIIGIHRLIITPNADAATHQLTRISPADADDPFIVTKSIGKGKTGASSPTRNFILHDKPPRIDLRPSLNKNATRRSSNLSSRTSTTSSTRYSVTPFLLPEDQEMVNQVGFSQVMAVIAKHYGFDVDVAMNAFFVTKSIEKTKSVLQHAKEVANSATSVLLAELVNNANGDDDADSYDDEGPRSMRRRSSSSRKDQSTSPARQKARRISGPHNAKRRSLNIKIKPQLFDEEIDQNSLSDYSPPRVSRAGQFMRLVKQGRRNEAVDREQRRASGAFVAQTQFESPDKNQQRSSLSLVPNSSPTFNANPDKEEPMIIDNDGCDDDEDKDENDFQPPVTPHEDTVQHPPPADISSPTDHHRIFLKRISEGQSTLNEDEDDPAVLKLAQGHRDLVMNLTEENADALRSFEQKNNPDLLRLWSLDWVRQKIADM